MPRALTPGDARVGQVVSIAGRAWSVSDVFPGLGIVARRYCGACMIAGPTPRTMGVNSESAHLREKDGGFTDSFGNAVEVTLIADPEMN